MTTAETVTVTTTVSGTGASDTTEDDEAVSTPTFQMPSRNIGCRFGFQQLRCDILSGLEPVPDEACDFDWVGVSMGVTGPAAANCGSDTVYESVAPALEYGSTWSRGEIVCESHEIALRLVRDARAAELQHHGEAQRTRRGGGLVGARG